MDFSLPTQNIEDQMLWSWGAQSLLPELQQPVSEIERYGKCTNHKVTPKFC